VTFPQGQPVSETAQASHALAHPRSLAAAAPQALIGPVKKLAIWQWQWSYHLRSD